MIRYSRMMRFLSHLLDMPVTPFGGPRAARPYRLTVWSDYNSLEIDRLNNRLSGRRPARARMVRSAPGNWGHSERGLFHLSRSHLDNSQLAVLKRLLST